jgi:hypothetical protein
MGEQFLALCDFGFRSIEGLLVLSDEFCQLIDLGFQDRRLARALIPLRRRHIHGLLEFGQFRLCREQFLVVPLPGIAIGLCNLLALLLSVRSRGLSRLHGIDNRDLFCQLPL